MLGCGPGKSASPDSDFGVVVSTLLVDVTCSLRRSFLFFVFRFDSTRGLPSSHLGVDPRLRGGKWAGLSEPIPRQTAVA